MEQAHGSGDDEKNQDHQPYGLIPEVRFAVRVIVGMSHMGFSSFEVSRCRSGVFYLVHTCLAKVGL
ncbi:hypothetical protein SDC9_161146 [bioreactor metagenome]|uniref:Uncharacterized protein n=1 Tax=bioreactor metagenome TaxID=1076179 RepID=A0A645FIP0_9ZZZZ